MQEIATGKVDGGCKTWGIRGDETGGWQKAMETNKLQERNKLTETRRPKKKKPGMMVPGHKAR